MRVIVLSWYLSWFLNMQRWGRERERREFTEKRRMNCQKEKQILFPYDARCHSHKKHDVTMRNELSNDVIDFWSKFLPGYTMLWIISALYHKVPFQLSLQRTVIVLLCRRYQSLDLPCDMLIRQIISILFSTGIQKKLCTSTWFHFERTLYQPFKVGLEFSRAFIKQKTGKELFSKFDV